MLTIYGNRTRFCDGVSRRNFLKVGALGLGGLALPNLLRAESASGVRSSHKTMAPDLGRGTSARSLK